MALQNHSRTKYYTIQFVTQKNELSSPTQTLRSWVPIQLEAWMSVCVYSVFVLSCVQVAASRRADPPSKEFFQLCKRSLN
jgi:hypothetical protein